MIWKVPTDSFLQIVCHWGSALWTQNLLELFLWSKEGKVNLSVWLVPSHFLESPVIRVLSQSVLTGGGWRSTSPSSGSSSDHCPSVSAASRSDSLLSLLRASKVWSLPERCQPSKPSSSILMKTRTAMSRWGSVSPKLIVRAVWILSSQRDFQEANVSYAILIKY